MGLTPTAGLPQPPTGRAELLLLHVPHRHLVGVQEPRRDRAAEKRPTADVGLPVALHTPTSHPPHHGAAVAPQRENAVACGGRGSCPTGTLPPWQPHHCQRLPCRSPELGQAKEEDVKAALSKDSSGQWWERAPRKMTPSPASSSPQRGSTGIAVGFGAAGSSGQQRWMARARG